MDAIQLACAIETRTHIKLPITFVTGDTNLKTAAQSEHFSVDDPNAHP
jgi:hypothetical protein